MCSIDTMGIDAGDPENQDTPKNRLRLRNRTAFKNPMRLINPIAFKKNPTMFKKVNLRA